MITVECPHVANPREVCPGCYIATATLRGCLVGEVTVNVIRDVEGDYSVIGGTHSFLAAEIESTTCGCEYSADEEDRLYDQAFAEYGNEEYDGPEYDAEDDLEDF